MATHDPSHPHGRRYLLRRVGMAVALLVALVALGTACGQSTKNGNALLEDDFALGHLDTAKWVHTVANDFQTEVVDVVDGRLHMAAATVGTDDSTVKYHGVRTVAPLVDLTKGNEISFDLDWNKQANDCYMTAGINLCPTETQNPEKEKDCLRIEYWGVWPGQNARLIIATKANGNLKFLDTEDWLKKGPGRSVTTPKVCVTIDGSALKVTEDGKSVFESKELDLNFKQAYLYVQHSSHSNYSQRDIFFDNIAVHQFAPTAAAAPAAPAAPAAK